MTEREKREREEFYQTVILSLDEIRTRKMSLSEAETLNVLQELLPMTADAGSRVEKLVRGILLNETDEPMDEETLELMFVGYVDAAETRKLYEAVQKNWEKALPELGWYCLDALSPIWTENLLQ